MLDRIASIFRFSAPLDTAIRRISGQHILRGHNPWYSFLIAAWLFSFGVQLLTGKSVVQLLSATVTLVLLASFLFRSIGGVLFRRPAKEQGAWCCATVADFVCDTIDLCSKNFRGTVVVTMALAEVGKWVSFGLFLCVISTVWAVVLCVIIREKQQKQKC